MREILSLTQTATAKTNTRVAADNTIRGSVTHLALIAATHFVEVNTDDLVVRNHLKQLPEQTKMIYNMMVDCCKGVPVFPVHPELIFSTDESTQFVYEGYRGEEEQFRLVTKSSCKDKGTNATYHVEESDMSQGCSQGSIAQICLQNRTS